MPLVEINSQSLATGEMDAAVADIFTTMLRRECRAVDHGPSAASGITATIVFSGTLEGSCAIEVPFAAAKMLADAFLGPCANHDEAMIDDTVGELCNIIAGGWKRRLGPPPSLSKMSVPGIERGVPQNHAPDAPGLRRAYAFDEVVFQVAVDLT